jgi:hypothetical protein
MNKCQFKKELRDYWAQISGYNHTKISIKNIEACCMIKNANNSKYDYEITFDRMYPIKTAKAILWHELGHLMVYDETNTSERDEFLATDYALKQLHKLKEFELFVTLAYINIVYSRLCPNTVYGKMAKKIIKKYKFQVNKTEEELYKELVGE